MRNEHNGFSIRAIRLLTLPHSRSVTTLPRVSALCATWREHALLPPSLRVVSRSLNRLVGMRARIC